MSRDIWRTLDVNNLAVSGMSDDDLAVVKDLLSVWQDRLKTNQRRTMYSDGDKAFDALDMYLPERLKGAEFYLGWGGMAVRKAAVRSQFDGFRLPGSDDPFELGDVLDDNSFGLEFSQGVEAAYEHGPSFTTITPDSAMRSGVQIQGHTAANASALWDYRSRLIRAGLTISAYDKDARPSDFTVYLSGRAIRVEGTEGNYRVSDVNDELPDRPAMVPMTWRPGTAKPFGQSRITSPVMALTDMAVRAYVRMEGNAELYSFPQLAIEGAEAEAFESVSDARRVQLAQDRLLAISKDADGDKPVIKQFQQATMQPHNDMLRTVAMAFCGETGLPPSAVGIIHDNPSSAEAIRAAEHDLLIDVAYQNKYVLATAAKRIAEMALLVRDGGLPEGVHRLSAAFLDPEFRSTSAKADAAVKLAVLPDVAESSVLLEEVFDEDKVERIVEERRRRQSSSSVMSLLTEGGATKRDRDEAEVMYQKARALQQLRASGVSGESAAQLVGLGGVTFDAAPQEIPNADEG